MLGKYEAHQGQAGTGPERGASLNSASQKPLQLHPSTGPAYQLCSPSSPPSQMLHTSGLFQDHLQHSGFPECQVPQVDTAGVVSSIRLLHSVEHHGAIIAGSVSHQVYTVQEAAPVLGRPEFGLIAQHNLLLEGEGKMYETKELGLEGALRIHRPYV